MRSDDGGARFEHSSKYARVWETYTAGWKEGAGLPMEVPLFQELMKQSSFVRDAIELQRYPVAKRQLEGYVSRMAFAYEESSQDLGLVELVATYAPKRLTVPNLVQSLNQINTDAVGEALLRRFLTAANTLGRQQAYAFVQQVFADVPYQAAVHPNLLMGCADEGMILDPHWILSLLSNYHSSERESVAAVLLTAVRHGWGDEIARELLFGFVDAPLADHPAPSAVSGASVGNDSHASSDTPMAVMSDAVPAPNDTPVTLSAGSEEVHAVVAGRDEITNEVRHEASIHHTDQGRVLLGIAIGSRQVTASEVCWTGTDDIHASLRFEIWCSTLTSLNGGLPTEVPAIPADFRPTLYDYRSLEQASFSDSPDGWPTRTVILALVPFAGETLSPQAAQEAFDSVHRHTLLQFLETS